MSPSAPPAIAGHSHIVALGVPLRSGDGTDKLVPLDNGDDRFVGFTGKWEREQSYFDALIRLSAERTILLSWMGNQYDAAFRIARNPPIDFVLSTDPDLPLNPNATLVPEAAINERLAEGFDWLTYVTNGVKKITGARLILCGSPPPKLGYSNLKEEVKGFSSFWGVVAQQAGVDFESFNLSEPLFLLKAWKLLQSKYERFASENGFEFLSSPDACHTAEGFLREDCWGYDYSHANARYGAVVRDKAWELIGRWTS